MYTQIDKQWNKNGQVTVGISTGDLARTGHQLDYLASLSGLSGFVAMPPKSEKNIPLFIPLEGRTDDSKTRLVQRLLAVATIWQHYTHVRAVSKDKGCPKNVLPYDVYRSFLIEKGLRPTWDE